MIRVISGSPFTSIVLVNLYLNCACFVGLRDVTPYSFLGLYVPAEYVIYTIRSYSLIFFIVRSTL